MMFFALQVYHTFILSKATMILIVGQNFGETGINLKETIRNIKVSPRLLDISLA